LKSVLRDQAVKEGGSNIAFKDRQGFAIPYSFTKDGKTEERNGFIETVSFIVAGYDSDGIGRAYYVDVPTPPDDRFSRNTQTGGDLKAGQNDVVTRILKGWAPEIAEVDFVKKAQGAGVDIYSELGKLEYSIAWGAMTIQDAVDYCVLMTRITERVQRFSDGTFLRPGGIAGVGGAIDVAIISTDGFQWKRQKEVRIEDD
jgi:hypothetical protein